MKEKKICVKKPAGICGRLIVEQPRRRGNQVGVKVYPIEKNQFFYTYSDGSRKVRDIEIDYDDYKSAEYEDIKNNISMNIAKLRREKDMSCEDIADDVGVSRQYIAQIENGERNVSLEILSKIAWSLDVNVEFLISNAPFKPSNIYVNKLVAEIRGLEPQKQKELCAQIIEKLWSEIDE